MSHVLVLFSSIPHRMFNTSASRTCRENDSVPRTHHRSHCCHFLFFTVGYLNYRYFCNFLFYVFLGMGYGALLSCRSFAAMSFARGKVSPLWRPDRGDETSIAFSFMLCLSIGIAVACLGGFHLYLLLTAQTTIEFHGKCRNSFQTFCWLIP